MHYEKFADGSVKCIEDEIPFELPEGWEWCRIRNVICILNGYAFKSTSFTTQGIPVIRISDINDGIVQTDNAVFVEGVFDERFIIKKGDLLIAMSGATTGKMGVYPDNEYALLNQRVGNAKIYNTDTITPSFRNLYFTSQRISILEKAYGGAQPNISSEKIEELLLPLPPIKEQHRIQIIASKLVKYVDNIESNQKDVSSLIGSAKSKILDLAIRGKLVPQDPNDEPASVLLECIRAEKEELIKQGKIKRDKKESIIFKGEDNSYYEKFSDGKCRSIEDELPFELPNGWEWCNLSMIGTTNIGLTYRPTDIVADGTIVLRSSNIVNDEIDLNDLVRVSTIIRDNQYVQPNDILICARNGSKALVGKCALICNLKEPASFGAFMAV